MGIVKTNFSHLLVIAQKENGGLWAVLRGVAIHANSHTKKRAQGRALCSSVRNQNFHQ